MCGYVDRCSPGSGWDDKAHRLLTVAARSTERIAPALGLFSGLCGLGFTTRQLGLHGTRYGRLTATIEAEVVPSAHALAEAVQGRSGGFSVSELDVVSGLTGVGTYLLTGRASPPVESALLHTLRALAALTAESGDAVSPWVTPPHLLDDEKLAVRYPRGCINCGLAHGIPGPLALLSLAISKGMAVAGAREFVASTAAWLVAHRSDDHWGMNWPTMVTVPATAGREGDPDTPGRGAWCYGVPGVARALWLAGTALREEPLQRLAIEAMASVYRRPIWARQIDSPTFCHGIAGLLQVTLRFYNDTGLAVFRDAACSLTDQILDAYEPESAVLGFRCVEPGGGRVDQPGILDGAAGVALALLAAATTVEPTWDRFFLLA